MRVSTCLFADLDPRKSGPVGGGWGGGAGCLGAARRPGLRNARGNAGYPGPRSPDPRGKCIRTRHPPWGRRANGSAHALMGVPGGGPERRSSGFGAIPKERGWICARDPPWGRRVKIPPERPMGGGFPECPRSGVETVDFPSVFPWIREGPRAPRVGFSGWEREGAGAGSGWWWI